MQPFDKFNKRAAMDPQELAISVLSWLSENTDQMSRFLALSGIGTTELRAAAHEPGFMAGLLDFMMGHEPDLIQFCNDHGIKPEDFALTWSKISGPGLGSGEI